MILTDKLSGIFQVRLSAREVKGKRPCANPGSYDSGRVAKAGRQFKPVGCSHDGCLALQNFGRSHLFA